MLFFSLSLSLCVCVCVCVSDMLCVEKAANVDKKRTGFGCMHSPLQTLIFAGVYTALVFLLTRFYSDIKCREQVRQVRRGIKDSSTSVGDNSNSGIGNGHLQLISARL